MSVTAGSGASTDRTLDSGARELAAVLAPPLEGACVRGRRTLVAATVPIARPDPVAAFALARASGHEAALWLQPAAGYAQVAISSAWTVEAAGEDRFGQVAAAWSDLVEDAVVEGSDDVRGAGPLLFGGFGFRAEAARAPMWAGFESARFDLPRVRVTVTPASAWLTLSAVVAQGEVELSIVDAAVRELGRQWSEFAARGGESVPPTPASPMLRVARRLPEPAVWMATVERVAATVARGGLDKAVLARRVDLAADGPIDVPAVLRRLEAGEPEATIFAVGRCGRTFLGATPEPLVRVRGRELRSVAMAGSIRRGADAAEDERLAAELMASDKDRTEQAIVVETLRRTLAPLTDWLELPGRPSVVRLRSVQHLATDLHGQLRRPVGAIELAGRLHPTPAIGGAPRGPALELIAREERFERGWYGAPLGWVDRRGDGEFVVAIRCALVAGRRASLFTGCGIVAGSDPGREWEESEIKLRTLAAALGTPAP